MERVEPEQKLMSTEGALGRVDLELSKRYPVDRVLGLMVCEDLRSGKLAALDLDHACFASLAGSAEVESIIAIMCALAAKKGGWVELRAESLAEEIVGDNFEEYAQAYVDRGLLVERKSLGGRFWKPSELLLERIIGRLGDSYDVSRKLRDHLKFMGERQRVRV